MRLVQLSEVLIPQTSNRAELVVPTIKSLRVYALTQREYKLRSLPNNIYIAFRKTLLHSVYILHIFNIILIVFILG